MTRIGRDYDTVERAMRLSGFVVPDEPSPFLPRAERIAELKRLVEVQRATLQTLPKSDISSGPGREPSSRLPEQGMSALDEEIPCSAEWYNYQTNQSVVTLFGSILSELAQQWDEECKYEPPIDPDFPPPPINVAACNRLQDSIDSFTRDLDKAREDRDAAFQLWYNCTTRIA